MKTSYFQSKYSIYKVEPSLTGTPLMQPPPYYGHFTLMAALLIQPPHYYSHFILAQKKPQSVIFLIKEYPSNETTTLIQPPG